MVNAETFAAAGAKYLGRSYDEMDCQELFERCAKDAGLSMDLKGSNAWFRKFRETGWTGSPEECKQRFGSIPKGAALFIHAFDGGEEKRGYHDGLGNASHIGIKTGTGKGAIHSSATRGCVAESEFHDKTIRNGGWNMVGLSRLFDYGDKINSLLGGGSDTEPPWEDPGEDEDMQEPTTATVYAESGGTVKMRASKKLPASGKALYDDLPVGTVVQVVSRGDEWTQVNYGKRQGWWIMTKFLVFDEPAEDQDPAEDMDPGDGFPDDSPGEYITIQIKAADALTVYTVLGNIREQIETQIGRG